MPLGGKMICKVWRTEGGLKDFWSLGPSCRPSGVIGLGGSQGLENYQNSQGKRSIVSSSLISKTNPYFLVGIRIFKIQGFMRIIVENVCESAYSPTFWILMNV
jgi:hypothetical protein